MIHDPPLTFIGTLYKARVSNTICLLIRVLIEDATSGMFGPGGLSHRVRTDEGELAQTVVSVVAASSGVDDESLVSNGVRQLLGPFIGAKANVDCAVVGRLLPRFIGARNDGAGRERG
jgi:hypothetical protein